jgi:hypothetical protein
MCNKVLIYKGRKGTGGRRGGYRTMPKIHAKESDKKLASFGTRA